MYSCFNLFLSLGKVFWLAGSLLIIGLASVVNPTIGWRWLIRIASIPGMLLILVFKVGKAPVLTPRHIATDLASPQAPRGSALHPPVSLWLSLCPPFTTTALSPWGAWEGPGGLGGGLQTSCWGDVNLREMAWLYFALQSLWLCCPAVALQHHRLQCSGCQRHPGTMVMGQASRGRQARQDMQKITSNTFSLVLATAHPLQSLHLLGLRKEASVKCSQSKWASGSITASPGSLMVQKHQPRA